MKSGITRTLALFLCLNLNVHAQDIVCSTKCICKTNSQKDGGNYLKMSCGEQGKIAHLDELELLNIASDLVQLNLANNTLKTFALKVELIALQKLNLSGNEISRLEEYQFNKLPKLRRLDLSMNLIKYIDVKAFEGLKDLDRLKLNHNQITTLTFGTLDALSSLKQLDISSNPLQCDCGLLWIIEYSQLKFLKLMSNPKCSSTFTGLSLKKIIVGKDIHCNSARNNLLPLLDLKPQNNQIVFEGDSLKLQCKAPSITDATSDSRLAWLWLDSNPKDHFSDISIIDDFLPNPGIVNSVLSIKKITRSHSGIWTCLFASLQGNHSKSITILVISEDTKYCPIVTTQDNKGTYIWPQTVVNHTVTVSCQLINDYYDATFQTASYYCSEKGTWQDLDTTKCSYISDTTRILEGFSKVTTNLLESVRHLKDFTLNVTIFRDPIDLAFAAETLENYLNLDAGVALSNLAMDVVNNLLYLPWSYLTAGEQNFRSCSKLVAIAETIAAANPAVLFQQDNIMIESFPTKEDTFEGLKCSWFRNDVETVSRLFSCTVDNNHSDATTLQGRTVEAAVRIMTPLFAIDKNKKSKDYQVTISMYSSSKLFPIDDERKGKEGVTSTVVGVKINNFTYIDDKWPIIVTIRAPPSTEYEVTPFTPVYWDSALARWTTQGCHFLQQRQDHVIFSCKKLGYYGLMQDVTYTTLMGSYKGLFKFSHWAIYAGNAVLFATFLTAILTYIFGFVNIQMPKKSKHCLINTWIAIVLLCFIYSFGIYQTEDRKLCQIIGLLLHYFTLCSMLWMCVAINYMYKRLSKNGDSILQDDDLPSEQPIKKPIMGLYLVGWGVALIICGLSAAINIRDYSTYSYCSLGPGPGMSALYIPITILVVFLVIFFLMVRCAISNLDMSHGGHLSEGTQATEHVDLDLLEPNFAPQDGRSVRSCSSKTASSETEDNERSPLAQLKAHVIFAFLFVIAWLSCAFATVPPLGLVPYESDLFSIAYGIMATTLSAFTVFFYCVARNDVRTQWMTTFRWMRRKRLLRSRTVSDTPPRIQIQPLPLPPISNGEPVAASRSSSRSSGRTKSNSLKEAAAATDLNGSISDRPSMVDGTKINNVNLIALHRAQYRSTVVPHIIENPVFYNPHQITVAKKFFRRQKRDMMKRNNLQTKPPRDVNSDATSVFSEPRPVKNKNAEQNMFGTNSKVNNTNIHVERVRKAQRKNPNILSDSGDEFDCLSDVPVEKIVINAERLRKKEISRNKTTKKKSNVNQDYQNYPTQMRTVSQQCTLEYSSENPLSDSILDKSDCLSPTVGGAQAAFPVAAKRVAKASDLDTSLTTMETFETTENATYLSVRRENSPVEESHHYVEIDDLRGKDRHTKDGFSENAPRPRLRSPSNFSRASSVSTTDIDDLYQQIRRGPLPLRPLKTARPQRAWSSPFLSDSEVTEFAHEREQFREQFRKYYESELDSADIETTV